MPQHSDRLFQSSITKNLADDQPVPDLQGTPSQQRLQTLLRGFPISRPQMVNERKCQEIARALTFYRQGDGPVSLNPSVIIESGLNN
jgi:hypothetical protein